MKLHINRKDAHTVDEVKELVIRSLHEYGFDTAETMEEIANFLGCDIDDIITREEMRIQFDGNEEGYYIPTITAVISSNYIDAGSDDYVYSVEVTEE